MSLLETDPDVVVYLLRRKASQWVTHVWTYTRRTHARGRTSLFACSMLKLLIFNHRSADMLQTEEPFALSERRSSSDSNKASSGELSPYDNNSPVLSERRGEPGSPGSEQLFRVPEQYSLMGQMAGCKQRAAHGEGSQKRKFAFSNRSPRIMGFAPRGWIAVYRKSDGECSWWVPRLRQTWLNVPEITFESWGLQRLEIKLAVAWDS